MGIDISRLFDAGMSVPLLFISGPFTSIGKDDLESITKLADKVAYDSWRSGWSVISPHKNCAGYKTDMVMHYNKWMVGLSAQLIRCDAILVLPGWQKSNGCKIEIELAKFCKIPVYFYEIDEIPKPRRKI